MAMRKTSDFWLGAVALLLGLVLFLQIPVGAAETHLNYGKNLPSDVTLSGSKLYEALYGADLTDAEKRALDALSEISLTYAKIPESVVDREYNSDTGTLTVLVESYEYIAQNGETVLWIPKTVTFNGKITHNLQKNSDGVYSCVFEGLVQSQTFTLDVDFYWQVMIPMQIADTLVTLPYTIGKDAYEQLEPYEAYQAQKKLFEDYLAAKKQYPLDKAAYETYLVEKASYDERKSVYDAYMTAKQQYDAQVNAYKENEAKKKAYAEAEAKFFEYEKIREQNAAFYDQYEIYVQNMEAIERALKIFDSAYVGAADREPGWTYYYAIKGPTAMSFLDALKGKEDVTGINRALLDEAKAASQALTEILVAFSAVRKATYESEFDKTVAKYAFYKEHYSDLCKNLKVFYEDLNAIYCTSGIPGLVESKGKTPQMQMMIAQSYALYTALDDSATMDPNWTLLTYSMNDILYKAHRLTDTNDVSPTNVTIPETEMVLPDSLMEPVEKPGEKDFDENMAYPALSWEGEIPKDPGAAPVEVKDPGNEPKEVLPPTGECPPAPMLNDVERALAAEYQAGVLKKRQGVESDQSLTLCQRVTCKRSVQNIKTVTFYGFDGEKIGEIELQYGQSLSLYQNKIPSYQKSADERYSEYLFLGWIYFGTTNPTEADFLDLRTIRVTKDLAITPYYQTTVRWYKVVWKVYGKEPVTQWYKYGETPKCPYVASDVARPAEGSVTYEFVGWSPVISSITSDVTYEAEYKKYANFHTVTWIVGNKSFYTYVMHGDTADDAEIPKEVSSDDYLYVFERWDKPFYPLEGDVTYTAVSKRKPLAENDKDDSVCKTEHNYSSLILKPTGEKIWLTAARDYALSQGKQLEVVWGDFSVAFSNEQLQMLVQNKCEGLRLIVVEAENGTNCVFYRIEFLNGWNLPIECSLTLEVSLSCRRTDGVVDTVYSEWNGEKTEIDAERYVGRLVFTVDSNAQIVYQPEYTLKYSDPTQNSQLTALPPRAAAGETVDLKVNCGYGYEVIGATLLYADGRTETVTGTTFVMPDEPVSVELKVGKMAFLITFVVEGEIYKELTLYFGDKLELPEPPTKAEDDRYTYTFAGWSPQVWNNVVYPDDRTPEFTAVFTAHEKSSTEAEQYKGSFLIRVVIIGIGGTALVVGVVLCIIYRKRVWRGMKKAVRKVFLNFGDEMEQFWK